MDVLQCIGVGLLILFAIRLLIRSDKIYHFVLICSAIFVMIISPVFWKMDFTNHLPTIIENYFNRTNGSLFPIFPWINFILAGAIFAKYFLDSAIKGNEKKFIKMTAISGTVLLLSGHFFYSGIFPVSLTSVIPNPVFFVERLGYVLVLATLCWFYNKWRPINLPSVTTVKAGKSFVLNASRESLLIYWLHPTVIYSMIWGKKV